MSAWTCPECGGGFPKPDESGGVFRCPWCAEKVHWDGEPVVATVTKTTRDADKASSGLLGFLRGDPRMNDFWDGLVLAVAAALLCWTILLGTLAVVVGR